VTQSPVVSVCIPAFNAAPFIEEAVESALRQSEHDLEVIVFDDASTDGTLAALATFDDSRLRVLRQLHTVGISRNRNSCVDAARGRYLAWLDADDVLCDGALARSVSTFERLPHVALVHGAHHVIGDDGRSLPPWPQLFAEDTVESGSVAFDELVLGNYVTASTVVVRRSCYAELGGYEPLLTLSGEDWEMWMRIARRYDLAYIATPQASHRRHDRSATAADAGTRTAVERDRSVIDVALGSGADTDVLRGRASAALAAKMLLAGGRSYASGDRLSAVRATLAAFRLAPQLARCLDACALPLAQARGDDYGSFRHGRALLARIHETLAGSRFARTIEKLAIADPGWEEETARVAALLRRVLPRDARVAAVDKHDPTLLHLAKRRGWHVPDLRLSPAGYPRDGRAALEHVEALRQRGASHLVLPQHAFWWLEHYAELRRHLDACRSVWADERCRVYELAEVA
jgi:glycosyltransferase involved in cell wall biosynthesis